MLHGGNRRIHSLTIMGWTNGFKMFNEIRAHNECARIMNVCAHNECARTFLPPKIIKMSTFEKVKRNILRDMDRSMTHTAASWANIMLKNTARLTDVGEQEKFWGWMCNPEEDDTVPTPVCNTCVHSQIDEIPTYEMHVDNDDEKSVCVKMKNTYVRNGLGMYIKTEPVVNTNSLTLEPSPTDLDSICEQKVD